MATFRPAESQQVILSISEPVFTKLQAFAKDVGVPTSAYAKMLFEAAYAARCAPTGDAALDASVARVLLLHRRGMTPAEISELVNLPAGLVGLTVEAWRAEIAKGAAA